MHEHAIAASTWAAIKYVVLFMIPFVEPQLSGILGALAYLIVRHELNMASLSIKSIAIVMFFGWLGSWATINIMAVHCMGCPDVWRQIASATVGFLSYDAMLGFGANTTSVIGFFTGIGKGIILKGIKKWNS